MRETAAEYFFGIDIGTAKVRVVVGMLDSHDPAHISIVGHGVSDNVGMRKGIIVHIDDTVDAIVQAVAEAERVSGIKIDGATVNINGSHVKAIDSTGVIAISNTDREISVDDRFRAEEAAAIVQLPPNQEIIQVFAKNYRVDGTDNIKDPVGMHGVRLEVDTHIVAAATPNLKTLKTVLTRAQLGLSHVTVSSLAAAEAVLTRQQKEAGTLLLDIGAGTTNMVVVEDGEVQFVGVLPVGGINITNDLAIGLRTDLDIAEKVKLEHAKLDTGTGKHKEVTVEHEKQQYRFHSFDIRMITEARLEELLEMVEKQLVEIGRSRKLPGGVVIVGGTANIEGIDSLTKEKLQLPARVGKLHSLKGLVDILDDPAWSTAIGLMQLDMLLSPETDSPKGVPNQGALGMIEGLIGRLRRSSKPKN